MTVKRGEARLRPGLVLAVLFVLALMPRLYSAQNLGWHWDYPGSFTLINFDEGGSCRAALDGFSYSTFIGRQTIALASSSGAGPPEGIAGDQRAVRAYCHSPTHITVARAYSALLGALTVVAVAVLALQLLPAQPSVAWTAAGLLALSGFHISESHSGTVDAPSVFFIYSFLAVLAWALRRRSVIGLLLSVPLAIAAVWTKYWVFALFAYLALLPPGGWTFLTRGFTGWRLTLAVLVIATYLAALTNSGFPRWGFLPLLLAYGLVIPWRELARPMALVWLLLPVLAWFLVQVELIDLYTRGTQGGRFGSSYGAIGSNKWLRNLVNIPAVLLVGLGIPACLFIPAGLRRLLSEREGLNIWACLLPLLAFLLFMAFLAPVTYYRHYLVLVPAAAIIAAMGLHATHWGRRPWFLVLFFLWPALLAVDLVSDYHQDPRIALRQWYAENPQARVFASFYVSPPVGTASALFLPPDSGENSAMLGAADYLILSENWYDTAFANELNGPRSGNLEQLVKTTPAAAGFYRQALAGGNPDLELVEEMNLSSTMPELVLHQKLYGNFQLFVGDLRILRVRP